MWGDAVNMDKIDRTEFLKQIQIDDLPNNIRDIAYEIGLDATLKLVKICGGQAPYIPKIETCEQAAKHRVIYNEFKASRSDKIYSELALKYNYSESYTRNIIKRFISSQ